MDFKGHFPVDGVRCHPVAVLGYHSRFSVCLRACPTERQNTVQEELSETFRRYGLPDRITMDNGSPWGGKGDFTTLTVWLIRVGVAVSYSRPYHPQTQGKDERFHRTLQREVLSCYTFHNLDQVQQRFDIWRHVYNLERPHESLNMQVPASRYEPSQRCFPSPCHRLSTTAPTWCERSRTVVSSGSKVAPSTWVLASWVSTSPFVLQLAMAYSTFAMARRLDCVNNDLRTDP